MPGTENEGVGGQVHPAQQRHDRAERAVARMIIGETPDIDAERPGEKQPRHGREQAAGRNPLPLRVLARGAKAIQE